MQATLNVRMDSALKDRGDRVLRDNNVSVTEAVRSFWRYLARTRQLPDFMIDENEAAAEAEKKRRLASFKKLVSLTAADSEHSSNPAAGRLPFMTDDELRDMHTDDLWQKYMTL